MFSTMASRLAGLRARYAEPHRAYHGQTHIDAMLAGLDMLGERVTDRAAAELAIWYHDAVYDPARPDNEHRSADLLEADLAGLVHPDRLAAAVLMVRLSAGHALTPAVPAALRADCALFLDLDMAILGATPAEFDRYERGIAAEYEPVHGAEPYRRGRRAFLLAQLDRPRLFITDHFTTKLEAQARANLARVLAG